MALGRGEQGPQRPIGRGDAEIQSGARILREGSGLMRAIIEGRPADGAGSFSRLAGPLEGPPASVLCIGGPA